MKKMIKGLMILSIGVFLSSFVMESDVDNYALTVEVSKLQNSIGEVQFALYNEDGSIPDQDYENYYKILKANISNGSSTVTFNDLLEGTYVVNILHDENKNGKIDKGFVLPKEGFGFSNYTSVGPTNRPKYSKASFELKSDMTIEVKVIYL